MEQREIFEEKASRQYSIDNFIKLLEHAKQQGATNFKFRTSGDKMWPFEWITFFKEISDTDVKKEKIDKLQQEIDRLKKLC